MEISANISGSKGLYTSKPLLHCSNPAWTFFVLILLSVDENNLCGASLCESHKIYLKNNAHDMA